MTDRLALALAELAEAIRAEVRAEATPRDGSPDRLLSIADAGALLGVGRSVLYGEIQAGRLHSLKVGRRRLIPSKAVSAYINEMAGAGGSDTPRPAMEETDAHGNHRTAA